MKKALIITGLLCIASMLFAAESQSFYRFELDKDGVIQGYLTVNSGHPITLGPQDVDASEVWPGTPMKYWEITANHIVSLSSNEIVAKLAADRNKRYVKIMRLDNQFYDSTEALLTALSDPRAGQVPPVKLDILFETDELLLALEDLGGQNVKLAKDLDRAINKADTALMKVDLRWWDTVTYHPELNW